MAVKAAAMGAVMAEAKTAAEGVAATLVPTALAMTGDQATAGANNNQPKSGRMVVVTAATAAAMTTVTAAAVTTATVAAVNAAIAPAETKAAVAAATAAPTAAEAAADVAAMVAETAAWQRWQQLQLRKW